MKHANQTQIPFTNALPSVTLTTDGACRPNPGRGAWAYVLRFGTAYKEQAGCSPHGEITTNNRMELTAILEGLSALKKPCSVTVRTDSSSCLGLLNGTGMKPHKRDNQDLVQAILKAMKPHAITAVWVRGHNGDQDNERCDRLADKQLTS